MPTTLLPFENDGCYYDGADYYDDYDDYVNHDDQDYDDHNDHDLMMITLTMMTGK